MKYKAVFLDLDGTLIDSVPLIMKSDKDAIEAFGYKVTHQKLRELSLLHSRDIAFYLMDKYKTSFDLFDFIDFRRKIFLHLLKKHLPKSLWFSDSKEFLNKASQKFKIAVVTGSRHMFVNEVFDKKSRSFVKVFVTSDDVEHKKPDIEPLMVAIKKLNLKKKEVLFIGDSIQDGLMCQRAGIDFIAKNTGISTENQLRKFKPILVTESFTDIEHFLEIN